MHVDNFLVTVTLAVIEFCYLKHWIKCPSESKLK